MGLGGCQGWPFRPTPVPARLDAPTPACLSMLAARAQDWTGKPVTLTPAAFATDARLVLSQPPILGPDGRRLNGRITDPPAVLTLVRVGSTCRVIHPDGGEEADLPGCTCQPLTPTSGPGGGMAGSASATFPGAVAAPPVPPPPGPAQVLP